MGHREELMAAARRCLEKRGYARTTSRHLATEAGAPLGTINYHYGSKEALLNAALMESIREWGDRMHAQGGSGPASEPADGGGVTERLERMWSGVLDSVRTDRPMLVATFEAFAQAEHSEEVRRQIADEFERARPEMAALLHGTGPAGPEATPGPEEAPGPEATPGPEAAEATDANEATGNAEGSGEAEDPGATGAGGGSETGISEAATARAVGSVHMALVAGLTQQWLVDPERAPSAAELAHGLRVVARSLEAERDTSGTPALRPAPDRLPT
ncbi:TetR/AcrR family transcriptional regulator [Streptomyces iconiensis]|uniref:TetR/AcrR family transcriptional regulator n=1 Tax=Streptomyces iconiensis TaxID=1384038 RepID=A0ABT6ZV07_9ACTN|nr:TetR/AcrR family transcriptional regulator [Streptomyces iconiensis]MDJ1132476.1 TetR/AcrR family transcriptional regulator [Streptomyces iconiensis]